MTKHNPVMTAIIKKADGNLDKAIRGFNRTFAYLTDHDAKQIAADSFNAAWCDLVPGRPLKIANGALRRFIRSGRIPPPAGYRVHW